MCTQRRPRFSIIIVSLNGRERLAWPLDTLRRCDPAPYEIIVVDNGSSDDTSAFVETNYPEVKLVRAPQNLAFAGGNNLGMLNARGDVLVLLNDDTEPDPDWLAPLEREFSADPRLGIAGVRLVYPDRKTVQHMGGMIELNGLTKHVDYGAALSADTPEPFEADYVTGAALAIRRETVREIGLLDHCFWPIYFEETDWCLRASRRNWRILVVPDSVVVHYESQTTEKLSRRFLTMYNRNRVRFLLKHKRGRELLRTLRAEARWIVGHHPWDNFWPLCMAYAWGILQWPEIERMARREGLR